MEFIEEEKKKKSVFYFKLGTANSFSGYILVLPAHYVPSKEKKKSRVLFFIFSVSPPYPRSFSFLCYHSLINIIPAERGF